MYRFVIIDRDQSTIEVIKKIIAKDNEFLLLGIYRDLSDASTYLRFHKNEVDYILMGVYLHSLKNYEFLNSLEDSCKIIFFISEPEFALTAFNFNTIDLLLKPISEERFNKSIEKIKSWTRIKESINNIGLSHKNITITSGQKKWKIQTDSIVFAESIGEYIKIWCTNQTIIALGALKDFYSLLPPKKFVRVHRSFIVSGDYISSFNFKEIETTTAKTIPIGRKYKHDFKGFVQRNENFQISSDHY